MSAYRPIKYMTLRLPVSTERPCLPLGSLPYLGGEVEPDGGSGLVNDGLGAGPRDNGGQSGARLDSGERLDDLEGRKDANGFNGTLNQPLQSSARPPHMKEALSQVKRPVRYSALTARALPSSPRMSPSPRPGAHPATR